MLQILPKLSVATTNEIKFNVFVYLPNLYYHIFIKKSKYHLNFVKISADL